MFTRTTSIVLAAVVLAACGGGDTATDTTASGTTGTTGTTVAVETTSTPVAETPETITGDTIVVDSLSDIPAECREIFISMLQTLEPAVEGVDFETATVEDLDAVFADIDDQMTAFDAEMAANECDRYSPDTADEDVWNEMLDLAESEAPGTVGFLGWTRELSAAFIDGGTGVGSAATGECVADSEALVALAEEGKTMQQMTLAEVGVVSGLMASISENCTVEELTEVLENPAVEAMIGG